jgi:hypothetical protein
VITGWIRKKSLKRAGKGKRLVLQAEPINTVRLIVLLIMLIALGLFVVRISRAFSGR